MDDTEAAPSSDPLDLHGLLFDTSPDLIAVLDSQFVFRIVNPAYARRHGRTPGEIVGSTVAQLVGEDVFRETIFPRLERCFSGESSTYESWFTYPTLGPRYMEVRYYPLRNDEQVSYAVAVIRDFTDQKASEDALKESKEHYRIVADFTYDWEHWLGADGTYIYVSPSCERLTGYRAAEFTDDPELLEKIAHPDDREMVSRHLKEEHSVTGEARSLDFRIISRDGEERWIGHVCQPVYDRDGHWLGWRGSNRDFTAQRRVEQGLRESEEKFRRVFEDCPIGMVIAPPGKHFLQANPAFCKMLGYTEQELKRMTVRDITHPDDWSESRDFLRRLARGDISSYVIIDKRYIRKNGEVFWGRLTVTMLGGHSDEQIRGLAMLEDMTEQRKNEQLREQYVSFISHDLRAPLSVVIGQASILRSRLSSQRAKPEAARTESILNSAWRMNSMIQDLQESSRLESGKWTMHREPADLGQLLSSVCDQVVSPEQKVRLRMEQPSGPTSIEVDHERFGRALANLVTNALKYSPSDSPVTITLDRVGQEVLIAVADQGAGIPLDEQPLVFDRFYRAVHRKKAEGIGLGLYITRLIVEAHGGRIWVESKEGEGSTFAIALPITTH